MDIRAIGKAAKHELPKKKTSRLYSSKSLKQKQSKDSDSNETYKTKLNFKSTMNLSFGKFNKNRLSQKAGLENWEAE